MALHTEYRCTLALNTMSSAMSRVSFLVHVSVAYTHSPSDGGHLGISGDPVYQFLSAPGYQQVYVFLCLEHLSDEFAVS